MKKYTLRRGYAWDSSKDVFFHFDTIAELRAKYKHELKTVRIVENGVLTVFIKPNELLAKNVKIGINPSLVNWIYDFKVSPMCSIYVARNF